jgi:hypothetical protein
MGLCSQVSAGTVRAGGSEDACGSLIPLAKTNPNGEAPGGISGVGKKEPDHRHPGLLCAPRERRRCRTADRSDEFAPSKANASSAPPTTAAHRQPLAGGGLEPPRYLIIME